MKKQFTLLCFMLLNSFMPLLAQEVVIEDVRKNEFKGVKAIINKATREPAGYYTFYVNEKLGGGMVEFNLELFDTQLQRIKTTPITITKRSMISSSVFNGNYFFFAFSDPRKKALTFVTIDQQGDIVTQKEIEADKRYLTTAEVFPAKDAFYIIRPIKEKKIGYTVQKVTERLETIWEKPITPEKGYIGVEAIASDQGRLIITHKKGKAMLSRKMVGQVLGFNDQNGELLFTYDLFDGEKTAMPSAFLIEEDKSLVMGGMYFDGEKWDNTNSDGIFFIKLSPEGKQINYSTNSWKGGIQKFLKASTTGFAIGSKPKLYFEGIVKTPTGYRVISETFRKNIAIGGGLRALAKAISGTGHVMGYDDNNNSQAMTFEIMDMMLFNFSNEGSLAGMTHIPKPHTKITLLSPYNNYGGLALSQIVADFGYFDYCYSTTNPATGELIIVSRILNKRPIIGVYSVDPANNSYTRKEVELERMPGDVTNARIGALPGTNGKMCVYFYNKAEKTITIYLDNLDLQTGFTSAR